MIFSKFKRNECCTYSFENNFRLQLILHRAIVAFQVARVKNYPGSAFHGLAACNKLSRTCNAFPWGPRADSQVRRTLHRRKRCQQKFTAFARLTSHWSLSLWHEHKTTKQNTNKQKQILLTNYWPRSLPSSKIHQVHYRSFSHHLSGFIFSFLNEVDSDDGVCTTTEIENNFLLTELQNSLVCYAHLFVFNVLQLVNKKQTFYGAICLLKIASVLPKSF